VLLVAAWTFAPVPVLPALVTVLLLWLVRDRVEAGMARFLDFAAFALMAIILVWTVANAWMLFASPRVESSIEPIWMDRTRSVFNLQISAVVIFWLFCRWIYSARSPWPPIVTSIGLLALLPTVVEASLFSPEGAGSAQQIAAFADWRKAIPPTSSVLVIPPRKAASFVWFTLERPSYLSVDQSSGVVFSRATAMEIRRRSQVLLPVSNPDWEILDQIDRLDRGDKSDKSVRPLTAAVLSAICRDPALGFVVAAENLGFDPLKFNGAGDMHGWNLYDCRKVRALEPAAGPIS
jgi:hypothetical protein